MKFTESRGNDGDKAPLVSFSAAILDPMSSFGGIYVPEQLPSLGDDFLKVHRDASYKVLARSILSLCDFDLDDEDLSRALNTYDSFDDPNNPVPVIKFDEGLYISELYHGPTRAFKDMALQPLKIWHYSLSV